MLALMTDHCDRFDAQPATTASTPMSSQLREPSFDCDPNLASLTPAAIMPVLLHHSKRKRLDAVLTKLSLSSCKDESFLLGDEAAELAKEHAESESSRRSSLTETVHQGTASSMFTTCSEQQEETREKTPQKQRSVDSEMAQECRLMALDDQRSTKSPQSLTHSRVSRESSFNSSSTEHEVTDTTTVMRHTSDNLFGAHRQQLQLPRAKLVTRRRVPDTNSRTESTARVVESGPSSAPPFCTSLLSRTYLGLSCDTLPSFPICECSHCRTLCSQTSSKMPTLSSVTPSHHHPWSWHSLKQESPHMLIDPFTYLLSTKSKLARDKPSSPIMPIPSSPPQVLSSSLGKHELNLIELAAQSSSKLAANQKKRSHSDSDMTHEYLSLFKSLAAQKEACLPHLQSSEPGVLLKNGRRVPKPLSRTTAIHFSSEQDSPLDLSVKYADLISAPGQPSVFGTSSSVPSLHTLSNKPFRFSDSSSAESVTLSDFSLRAMPLALHKVPFKRSNISGSDSLNSSSLSSISSLSPPYLPSAETKSSKVPRARFEFSEERANPILADSNEPESVSSSNHVCTLCGQSFLYYDRLAKHMASRHRKSGDTVKNYQCGICSRSFARSDMLTRHMRLHTGHKPYTCGICDQVFSRSDHLSTHQRTHTGDKPYKCPQCPYAACRRDMITRHMKTHSRYEIPDSSTKSA